MNEVLHVWHKRHIEIKQEQKLKMLSIEKEVCSSSKHDINESKHFSFLWKHFESHKWTIIKYTSFIIKFENNLLYCIKLRHLFDRRIILFSFMMQKVPFYFDHAQYLMLLMFSIPYGFNCDWLLNLLCDSMLNIRFWDNETIQNRL